MTNHSFENKIFRIGEQSFLILSLAEIKQFQIDKPHVIISITEPGANLIKFKDDVNRIGLLRLDFSDVHEDTSQELQKMTLAQGFEVVNFVKHHQKENPIYVIHCTAGYSRSPAVAAAIAAMHDEPVAYFWERFFPNGHVFSNVLLSYVVSKRHASLKSGL